jgi:predicted enzyme related to lactoylglutathione lyase
MSNPGQDKKIDYIEFNSTDIERTKQFYTAVFGWSFKDWGPDYIDFSGAGVKGGFAKGEPHEAQPKYSPMIVIYSANLEAAELAVVAAGGSVVVPTFAFPGGRRFHFSDGVGNVLGVWSE